MRELSRGKQLAVGALVLVGVVGLAVALGVVGTPGVETVENRFTGVSENTTTIETAMTVSNPNPVGVRLGGTTIDYTVSMNDVAMASGEKTGVSLGRGNTTVKFTTRMQNRKIPAWWASHIANRERTRVQIDANVSDSLVGDRTFTVTRNRTVETDILGQFNSTETRPVNASRPFVSDPVLYINETRGWWDRENLTDAETPLDIEFDVYNPKPVPYTTTKIGYTTYMNDIRVGSGETESGTLILPGERETIGIQTTIDNDKLDQWWVTHLQRNQNTTMYIDFYLIVEGGGEQFRIDLDAIDYEKSIATDFFGNKEQYPTGDGTESSGPPTDSDASDTTDSGGSPRDGSDTDTPAQTTESGDDGGIVDGGL